MLSLVAMGTGTDEDVSQFSGCLRLRTRACARVSLQTPLSEHIRRACPPVYVWKGAPYVSVARVREELNPQALSPPWKGLGLSFTVKGQAGSESRSVLKTL